ncbi:clumping factor B-like [Coccinella septempunctata]|uniref:clumping factor B-like n=1 Tax=Coccinella septempunctata TaxID=41139 RepID=UPI001D05D6AB|nr:clumping factor B-like [Coccinella septempunctata]
MRMNVVLRDDFHLSENESEYFSGTDGESEDSHSEISDTLYEGDAESDSFDEEDVNSESSTYERSVNDVIEDVLIELRRDCDSDNTDNEFEIYKEDGSDVEVLSEEVEDCSGESNNEDFSDSFDDSDSDFDEEFISFIIRNTKYQLKKMMMAFIPKF